MRSRADRRGRPPGLWRAGILTAGLGLTGLMPTGPGLAAAAPASPSFVGIWYGEGEPDDGRVLYIDAYHADGTFNSEFRKCEKGQLVWRQTETGTWSVANGVLTMSAKTVDGKPAVYDNSYAIESLTGTEFHAHLHNPDYLFVEKRVAAFEFPPCYVGA